MDSQCSPSTLDKNLEIPTRLCRFDYSERVLLFGHWQIHGVIARYLQEDPGVWPTLVCLARGVQEARAKS